MRKTLRLMGLISLVVIFMSSCSKDDDNPTESTKTVNEYLTAGNWKVTALTIDPGVNINGVVLTDFFAQMPSCTKDDLTKFNSNGTITDDEGATKCDPNDPQTTNDGTWVLSADNTSVTMSYPGEDPTTVVISQLDGSVFKGTYTLVENFGSGLLSYTFTVTMTLQ